MHGGWGLSGRWSLAHALGVVLIVVDSAPLAAVCSPFMFVVSILPVDHVIPISVSEARQILGDVRSG